MNRIIGLIVFGLMVSIVYFTVQYVYPWANLTEMYQMTLSRLGSERALAVFLLFIYLFLAVWTVVALVRWMVSLAIDLVQSVRKALGMSQQGAANQTLDNSLIIDSPELKRPVVRLLETIFSVAVWLFFVYLLQTIASTFMWIFGLEKFYDFNFSLAMIDGTLDAILLTVYTAAFFIVAQIAWAEWNSWKYGRLNRRKPAPLVEEGEVASFFCQPIETIRSARAAKVAFITPLADGFTFRQVD